VIDEVLDTTARALDQSEYDEAPDATVPSFILVPPKVTYVYAGADGKPEVWLLHLKGTRRFIHSEQEFQDDHVMPLR
jgi:hypothetical protein